MGTSVVCEWSVRYPSKLFLVKQFCAPPVNSSDKEIEKETEYIAAPTSGAVDLWLSAPAQDIRKLDLSFRDNM